MLDNKQCEAFFAVAEMGSIEHAAKKLCITASAVTLRLQALEKNLGQLLLIRAKPCVLTQAGQRLFDHLQKAFKQEQDLIYDLQGKTKTDFFKFVLASNADSLATWLLPTLQKDLLQQRILLEVILEDQLHTHALFEKGIVNACISSEAKAMKGCVAQYLGVMQYRMICTMSFKQKWFIHGLNRDALSLAPAVIFNQKDMLHVEVLKKEFGLLKGTYPFHLIPSSESFVHAIKLGLGYGMVPQVQLREMEENIDYINLIPDFSYQVPLYWHHWDDQSKILQHLTASVVALTRKTLGE